MSKIKPTIGITKKDIAASYESLSERATPNFVFVVLTSGAAAICSFGFKMDNVSVIVGAMVVSPLLYSVVCMSVASCKRDWAMVFQGTLTLIIGLCIAIGTSVFLNTFFTANQGSEILTRLGGSDVDYFFVAFFSGLAGTLAFFWPKIIEAVAGIAISVALIPPVVMVGIGLANLDYGLIVKSVGIVGTNIVGIFLGSFLMFLTLHYLAKK